MLVLFASLRWPATAAAMLLSVIRTLTWRCKINQVVISAFFTVATRSFSHVQPHVRAARDNELAPHFGSVKGRRRRRAGGGGFTVLTGGAHRGIGSSWAQRPLRQSRPSRSAQGYLLASCKVQPFSTLVGGGQVDFVCFAAARPMGRTRGAGQRNIKEKATSVVIH